MIENIEGTITNVKPSGPRNEQNGCSRQEILIRASNGREYAGVIQWKKQPYAIGMTISATADPNQDGNFYFKRVNPGYNNQPQQQGQQGQQWQQPQGQQAPQQQVYSYPDAKDLSICRQCCIKAAADFCTSADSTETAISVAARFEAYCLDMDLPVTAAPQPSQPAGPNPEYDPNQPPPPDDSDIPF